MDRTHTFPSSPEEIRISMPYTSPSANVAASKSRFCASLGFRMMRFLPSMTFWVCWQDSMPKNATVRRLTRYLERQKRTFNGFAVPCRSSTVDDFCHRPVSVPDFDGSHCELSSVPCGLDHICTTARDRVFCGCADHDGLRADRGKAVNLGTKLDFDNIVFSKNLRGLGIRSTWNRRIVSDKRMLSNHK